MRKRLINIIMLVSFFMVCIAACSEETGSRNTIKESPAAVSNKEGKILLPVNLEKEKEIQKEVDNGGAEWRLNPIDVARAALAPKEKIGYSECRLMSEKERDAVVECRRTKVYLKRLVKEKGIWTAEALEQEK